jgi:hypothetical protein
MPKVDVSIDPKPETEEPPLHLDFVASRPSAEAQSERASPAPAEDPPLHLDRAAREPPRGRSGTTYHGFAQDPAAVRPTCVYPPLDRRPVRGRGPPRGLLVVGLAAVIGLGVTGALWGYSVVERRIMPGGTQAEPAAASAPVVAPIAAVEPPAQIERGDVPAQIDAAPLAPAPALPQEPLAEPAPEVARPTRHEASKPPRQTRSERPGDSAATARANLMETYAPASTLSAQAQAQPFGD